MNLVKEDMTMLSEEYIGNCANNRPDIIRAEKATRKWKIIDIAVPSDFNVVRTEDWKVSEPSI